MDTPRILLGLFRFGQSYMHLPALFARTGFPVDAVVTTKHPLRRSRWLKEVTEVDPTEWAATIDEKLASGRYVFFANVDEPGLIALYRHFWSPESRKLLPFDPDSTLAQTVGDKEAFYAWCEARGLPVPETHRCETADAVAARGTDLTGKWLLKGATGMGGTTVWPWDEPRHTPSPFETQAAAPEGNRWLLQKHEGNDVGAAMFLAINGKLLAWFGVRKKVCLNRGYGPMVIGSGDCDPAIGELCEAVAAAGNITGLTGFDYVVSPERGPLLIDSHLGRTTTMNHFGAYYGVDFAPVLRAALVEGRCERIDPSPGPDVAKFTELLEVSIRESLSPLVQVLTSHHRVPVFPPGDWRIAVTSAVGMVVSCLRVRAGQARRRAFTAFSRAGSRTR